ncbi:helix-turn-helix domain-containing protein [bacterium]|nr:helix-turn-helix domain-containing protein [bacterium]
MTSSNPYPFVSFGMLLARARKSAGKTSLQMAEALALPVTQYESIENGSNLPDRKQFTAIAALLKKDVSEIRSWVSVPAQEKVEDKKEDFFYKNEFLEGCQTIRQTQGLWKYKPLKDDEYESFFSRLQKDVNSLSAIPHLPENIVFLFEVLSLYKGETLLKDCEGFFPKGESLAGYLARSPHIGFFLFHTANRIFFADQPETNLLSCFNRLSINQLKELLTAVLSMNGVYSYSKELPYLQQQDEFVSLAVLMTRELSPYLKGLNVDHLILAVMAQNIGEHALFKIFNSWNNLESIDRNFLYHVVYELHPVVSAIMAKKWGLPQEACNGILNHHSRSFHEDEDPFVDTTPFEAAMKIIAHLTDWGFSPLTEDKTQKISTLISKANVPASIVNDANNNMFMLRQNLVEVSSTILDKVDKRPNKSETIVEKRDDDGNVYCAHYLSRNDFRFTPSYQKTLILTAKEQIFSLLRSMFLENPEPMESYSKKTDRIRRSYACLSPTNNIRV